MTISSQPPTESNEATPPAVKPYMVRNPFPWYSPRFWHGMRLGTWLRHLAGHRFVVSPTRIPMAMGITAVGAMNSVLAGLERLVYGRQIERVELAEPPLFILGHWRSGTTFLHELLIRDPEHTYPNTFQCYAPNHFVLTERWLMPLTAFLLPSRRPMDNMTTGWLRPQEDEFALANLGVGSPYLTIMFPSGGPVCREYLDLHDLTPAQRAEWQQAIRLFFQRLAFRNNRRIIVKSPAHTARIRTLVETFPGAKFVHIVRDPYDIYASTVRLWQSLHETQGLHLVKDDSWLAEYVLSSFERMYAAFEEDRRLLGDDKIVELRYEDLVADAKGQLVKIYNQLGLGDFTRVESAVDAHLAEVTNYRPNRFQLDAQTRRTVHERWAGYFERYGYEQ